MEPGRKSPKREICRSKASRWASRAGRESGINGTPPPSVLYTLGYMPQKKKHAHANFHVPHPCRFPSLLKHATMWFECRTLRVGESPLFCWGFAECRDKWRPKSG